MQASPNTSDTRTVEEVDRHIKEANAQAAVPVPKCPDALLPDGPVCPRCGGRRGESGVDGGSWVHIAAAPEAPAQADTLEKLTRLQEDMGLYDEAPAQPLQDLARQMKPLEADAARIIADNLPDLYATSEAPAQASQPTQAAVPSGVTLWALLTNGKPNSPKVRSISTEAPSKETIEIAAVEGETWVAFVPLTTHPATNEAEQAGERETFEAHELRRTGKKPLTWDEAYKPEPVPQHVQGKYLIKADQQAWEAWQARAALQRTEQREIWQPIETAPKDGTSVLLYTPEGVIEGYWEHRGWEQSPCSASYDMAYAYISCKPTHWMPLPVAPGITKKEG